MSDAATRGNRQAPEYSRHEFDLAERSLHHQVLGQLVAGSSSILTADLNRLYDAVAPVAYGGTTSTPISSRRHRLQILKELRDDGVLAAYKTEQGWLWIAGGPNGGER